nr:DUF3987 domain-containing protein [uncultured Steroidobacter sp.]
MNHSTDSMGQPGNSSQQDSGAKAPVQFWNDDKPQSDHDKFLAATQNLLAAEDKREASELRRMTGNSVALQFRMPKDIFRTAIATPFEFDEVPATIAKLAQSFSEATGFDRSGVIVAALVAAASAVDDRYRLTVRPESNWYESARLWAVLIGTPSAGKTPSIRAATNPIKAMHEAEVLLWLAANRDLKEAEREPRPALYTSDATIPALQEVLKVNERGLMMLTEEFATWIGAIDATDKGEGAQNRGNWLQLYDGGSKQFNRINRGDVFVPNWSASVLAACTPDGLRGHMKQLPDDGLVHRFIPAIMGMRDHNRKGDARPAEAEWASVLRWLRENTRTRHIEMSAGARKLFDEEERHKSWLSDSVYESSPQLASHLGKHGGMLARVALTFHACTDPNADALPEQTMWLAIKFMRRVAKHSAAMFDGILGTSPPLALARALGRSIVAEAGVLTTIGRDWMSSHSTEFRKADDRVRREAVQILEDADWIEAKPGARSYGGWPRSWEVNDQVMTHYSRQGVEWRARRAAVREAIGLEDPD